MTIRSRAPTSQPVANYISQREQNHSTTSKRVQKEFSRTITALNTQIIPAMQLFLTARVDAQKKQALERYMLELNTKLTKWKAGQEVPAEVRATVDSLITEFMTKFTNDRAGALRWLDKAVANVDVLSLRYSDVFGLTIDPKTHVTRRELDQTAYIAGKLLSALDAVNKWRFEKWESRLADRITSDSWNLQDVQTCVTRLIDAQVVLAFAHEVRSTLSSTRAVSNDQLRLELERLPEKLRTRGAGMPTSIENFTVQIPQLPQRTQLQPAQQPIPQPQATAQPTPQPVSQPQRVTQPQPVQQPTPQQPAAQQPRQQPQPTAAVQPAQTPGTRHATATTANSAILQFPQLWQTCDTHAGNILIHLTWRDARQENKEIFEAAMVKLRALGRTYTLDLTITAEQLAELNSRLWHEFLAPLDRAKAALMLTGTAEQRYSIQSGFIKAEIMHNMNLVEDWKNKGWVSEAYFNDMASFSNNGSVNRLDLYYGAYIALNAREEHGTELSVEDPGASEEESAEVEDEMMHGPGMHTAPTHVEMPASGRGEEILDIDEEPPGESRRTVVVDSTAFEVERDPDSSILYERASSNGPASPIAAPKGPIAPASSESEITDFSPWFNFAFVDVKLRTAEEAVIAESHTRQPQHKKRGSKRLYKVNQFYATNQGEVNDGLTELGTRRMFTTYVSRTGNIVDRNSWRLPEKTITLEELSVSIAEIALAENLAKIRRR